MSMRSAVPLVVVGMAAVLAVVVLINFAIGGDEPDRADLVPPPDSIPWHDGDEVTAWLETNRHDVELRLPSVELGIAHVDRVFNESGQRQTASGEGCLDFAVSSLTADNIHDDGFNGQGTIERTPGVGDVTVFWRLRWGTDGDWRDVATTTVPAGSDSFTVDLSSTVLQTGTWQIEASHSDRFQENATRRITVDLAEVTTTTDSGAQRLQMLHETGVGLVACSDATDIVLTLHGEGGEELNRYRVGIMPEPMPTATPSPTPVPTPTPDPYVGRLGLRVCVDTTTTTRDLLLSGGEKVGDPLASTTFDLAGGLEELVVADVFVGNDFVYFFDRTPLPDGFQLAVSDAGASGLGLDADRVYPLQLTAIDDTGLQGILDVGVWLDATTASDDGDGSCPP